RMWQDYLNQTQEGGSPVGIKDGDIESIALSLLESEEDKVQLQTLMNQLLRSVEDVDFRPLLEFVGIKLHARQRSSWNDTGGAAVKEGDKCKPWLGAMLGESPLGAKITHVFIDKAASKAGLSAGDVIIAIDGIQANAKNIEKLFANFSPGQQVKLHGFRDDLLMDFELQILEGDEDTYYFTVEDETKCQPWVKS
ncbi:MAG: PDZ domain-containing protein, partial [Pseudomonadales bacterium]|nr:PDZ domain-containing protein [Pseudomonadales bacterium]